jgi:hypothetical protein
MTRAVTIAPLLLASPAAGEPLATAPSTQRQAALTGIETLYAAAKSRCDFAPSGWGVLLCRLDAWRARAEASQIGEPQ